MSVGKTNWGEGKTRSINYSIIQKASKALPSFLTCSKKSVDLCSLCKWVDALRLSLPRIFFNPVPELRFVGEVSLEGDAISAMRLCWEEVT